MKKVLAVILGLAVVICCFAFLAMPSEGGMDGEVTIYIERLDADFSASGSMSIAPASFQEGMMLSFGDAIRETTMFSDTADNINPEASYAVWAVATVNIQSEGEVTVQSSTAQFGGVPGGPLADSTYATLATSLGETRPTATGIYTEGQSTITQPSKFSQIKVKVWDDSTYRWKYDYLTLKGKHLDNLVLSVGISIEYTTPDGTTEYATCSADLGITVTSWDTAQIVCSISDISQGSKPMDFAQTISVMSMANVET